MKTYIIAFCCLLLGFSSVSAQVPFQGVVTVNILPIKKAYVQGNMQVIYHSSFNGNLKVFVNEALVFDKEVNEGPIGTLNLGGSIPNSARAIMKIVVDDLFYLEEVLHFHHPYLRIHYQKEDRQLALHYEDGLPRVEEMQSQSDMIREQVLLAIRKQLGEGDR